MLAHHIPDPKDDGACADMEAQAAACGMPSVPREDHHLETSGFFLTRFSFMVLDLMTKNPTTKAGSVERLSLVTNNQTVLNLSAITVNSAA